MHACPYKEPSSHMHHFSVCILRGCLACVPWATKQQNLVMQHLPPSVVNIYVSVWTCILSCCFATSWACTMYYMCACAIVHIIRSPFISRYEKEHTGTSQRVVQMTMLYLQLDGTTAVSNQVCNNTYKVLHKITIIKALWCFDSSHSGPCLLATILPQQTDKDVTTINFTGIDTHCVVCFLQHTAYNTVSKVRDTHMHVYTEIAHNISLDTHFCIYTYSALNIILH